MWSDSDEDVIPVVFEFLRASECDDESKRSYWVHPYNKIREQEGTIINKISELRADPDKFQNFTSMKIETFDYLLELIGNKIVKQTTNYRKSISPPERLIITLRYLSTGETLKSLSFFFRCGAATVEKIVRQTCEAIWAALSPIYLPKPDVDKWCSIADEFNRMWNFPNCLGAIDGKHIRIQRPPASGSKYLNYKKFHSINLLAVADARAQFIYVDVADFDRNSNSCVFENSSFGKRLMKNELNLPDKRKLNVESNVYFPFVFVADEAYPLQVNIMRPFTKKHLTKERKIYNYRLSRAKRIVECTFDILTKKFRIFEKPILLSPDKAQTVVLATCALYNMIRERENLVKDVFCERDMVCNSEKKYNTCSSPQTKRPSNAARVVRNKFVEYFDSDVGSVPWQTKYAI